MDAAAERVPCTPPAARRLPAETLHPCAVLRGACAVFREASHGDAGSRSTTAGSTPEPLGVHALRPPSSPGAAASPWAAQAGSPPQALSRQTRKLFVGGVPQEMNEGELQRIFAGRAPVEKVWLQRHRGDWAPQRKQHRGFGYVVFCEPGAVDQLLGDQYSRFLEPGDGVRLEVKRALSNRDIQSGLPWSPEPRPSPDSGVASPCPGQPWRRCLAWSPDDWDMGPRQQNLVLDQVPTYQQPPIEEGLMRTPPPAPRGLLAPEGTRDAGATHAFFSPFSEGPAHPGALVAMCAAAHGGPEALECALREAMPDHYED